MTESSPPAGDERRVHRIVVDVLATAEQVQALREAIGEALCGVPDLMHDGPCRIAWKAAFSSEKDIGDDESSHGLDREAVRHAYAELSPTEVWPREDVDRSLGLTAG